MANKTGDHCQHFAWDGPEDSDEEIAEMIDMKTPWEKEMGIKYSKRGLVTFIEETLARESANNKDDPNIAKLWKSEVKTPVLQYWCKKGGSHLNKKQPFLRLETSFHPSYKL